MRGFVFTGFLDFVESQTSPELVESMLDQCDLPSGGAYTATGTYQHSEILAMLHYLNRTTGQAVNDMLMDFGQHLFSNLIRHHPEMHRSGTGLLDFLEGIETHIHREVRKLYPNAELPFFDAIRPDPRHLVLNYSSTRPFAGLAAGMIAGAVGYFDDKAKVEQTMHQDAGGLTAQFRVTLRS